MRVSISFTSHRGFNQSFALTNPLVSPISPVHFAGHAATSLAAAPLPPKRVLQRCYDFLGTDFLVLTRAVGEPCAKTVKAEPDVCSFVSIFWGAAINRTC